MRKLDRILSKLKGDTVPVVVGWGDSAYNTIADVPEHLRADALIVSWGK